MEQEGALPVVLAGVAKLKVEPGTAAAVVLVPKPPKAPERQTRRLEKTFQNKQGMQVVHRNRLDKGRDEERRTNDNVISFDFVRG